MDGRVVAGVAAIVLLVLLRVFAARRIAAHQGQYVWLLFLPTLFIGVAPLLISIVMFSTQPLLATLMAIGGAIYLALFVRFLVRISRAVTSTSSPDELASATTEPMVDFMSTLVGLGLIAGVVAVIVLILWGIIRAAN